MLLLFTSLQTISSLLVEVQQRMRETRRCPSTDAQSSAHHLVGVMLNVGCLSPSPVHCNTATTF